MKNIIILIAILVAVSSSCHTHHEHDKHHSKNEEVKIQLTAYSDEFELFAEADPFVTGEASNILSHFTHLPEFTALEKGSVTLSLKINNQEITQTLENPTRKGIYSFNLIPEVQGEGELLFTIKTEKGSFQITAPNVKVYTSKKEAHETAGKTEVAKTNTTVFTKEQSWKVNFATALPQQEPFGQIIKTTAQIQPAQNDEVQLVSKTSGIVNLIDNTVLPGKSVKKGQVLFLISGSGIAEENIAIKFIKAQNNYEKAKLDFERAQELSKDKIVSEKELLETRTLFENAKAIYTSLNKDFNSSGQKVVSTKDGFINHVFVSNGQHVEAGTPLINLIQNELLLLHAEVAPKYAPALNKIKSANIRTSNNDKTFTLTQLNGKILSVGKATARDNYLIPVYIQIDHHSAFVQGSFVDVFLQTASKTNALTVSNTAILEEQGIYFVFVQVTPELFEKREVEIGSTNGLKTEILKGISSTERIITKGAIYVKLAQATGTLDAHSGHVH